MRPATTRQGTTHTFKVSDVTCHFTINRDRAGKIIEVFAKSDGGMQGHLEKACTFVSLGLQGRCDVDTVIRHLTGDRTHPQGVVGQATSIYDAMGKALAREVGK